MTAEAIGHGEARRRWGMPHASEGCVNDPRTREENGIRWNEKWIYYLDHGVQRVVYWHRYDCHGVLRVEADGSVAPEGH